MFKKLLSLIFRQYDIGQWWGGFRHTVSNATMYITMFNTALLVPMAYVTWFQPWTEDIGIQIPFTLFLLIIFIGGVLLLLFEYKVFTPSTFNFWTDQWWKHNNPMKRKIDKFEKDTNKRLNEIERKLDEVLKQKSRD